MARPNPLAYAETETDDVSGRGFGAKVVLFNCDCHSFDEVERQLVKALRCSTTRARDCAREAHSRGRAVVYEGHLERCEAVAAVLAEIRLVVKVAR